MSRNGSLFQYPHFSMKEITAGAVMLYKPDGTSIDVTASSGEEFFTFVEQLLAVICEPKHLVMRRQEILCGVTSEHLDICDKFFVINQLALLDPVKHLGLIKRKMPICTQCLNGRREYVPADPGNGKYCKKCFLAKMKKSGCTRKDLAL